MTRKIVICLLIFFLTLSYSTNWKAYAKNHTQEDYTIPKKHRVIQETHPQSNLTPVDSPITDITFKSVQGDDYSIKSLTQKGPVIFVFLSVECPVAQRYTMRLKRIHAEFTEKLVTLVGVYSNENDSIDNVKANIEKAGFTFPIVKDTDGSLARHIGATMTPQAHLIDKTGILRYRGAIDDNRYETRIKHRYLKDALLAILNGKPISMKETAAFGCTIHLPDLHINKQITYNEHIAPILQKHCQTCHQQDGIAPFALTEYDDAKTHAAKIAETTQKRLMPPWNIVHGYAKFKNERHLSDTEIDTIANWVRTGTQEGAPNNNKPEAQSAETWKLGKPDMIAKIPIKVDKQSYNPDNVCAINIQPNYKENKYIRAIDFQIENKKSVHGIVTKHNLTTSHGTVNSNGISINRLKWTKPTIMDDKTLGVWTPSRTPSLLPEGTGFLLPQGAALILLVNYNPIENLELINLQIGIYFANTPKTAKVRMATLRARMQQQPDVLAYQFNENVYVLGVLPIKQINSQDMKIIAKTPIGQKIKMIWYKPKNINWNEIYYYSEPIFLPQNSRLEYDEPITYDNENSRNGLDKQTFCQFYYVLASEYDTDEKTTDH